MKLKSLFIPTFLLATVMTLDSCQQKQPEDFIGKNTTIFEKGGDLMTPEVLWAMGRIGGTALSPDDKTLVYGVTYYSVPQNKSHRVIYSLDIASKENKMLTKTNVNEGDAAFFQAGKKILFLSNNGGSNQLWMMNADGTGRKQLTKEDKDVEGFILSPDEKKIILIEQVDDSTNIEKKYDDLPEAQGMVINETMFKHWDQFVTTIPHPFVATFSENGISDKKDILEGEPYECPMLPFGGVEQLCWSPDSKTVAYTCRKKTGLKYAVSTDSDIFLYDVEEGTTKNICKSDDFLAPEYDVTRSLQDQAINKLENDESVGYDTNPIYSPDGKYIAWQSMKRDGYESDRNRLCVYDLATGKKTYVTESFDSSVETFCWGKDSKSLYFSGCWHATIMLYSTNLEGQVKKLTDGVWDYSVVGMSNDGKKLLAKRHSMSQADEVYFVNLDSNKEEVSQLTEENKYFYDHLEMGKVEERWISTVDGKQELVWVIYPPHFDASKKYPTLLYCEGGPQSPVSQFWSFRWNFQIMAAHGYVIVAPNRRGLPGFGTEWLEEISGDYSGLCQKDLLSAIDAVSQEPFVDKDRMGCVGASFGGYSVYWLAGNHNKRFKCFIAHDGIYNTEQQYTETEEFWFTNWDLKAAPWTAEGKQQKAFLESPHKFTDKWDTPILCIHGMKDYRILHSQGQAAFNAAKMRGVEAQLLLIPDENHWVLKPQNGILWQRTFFNWLEKWLKK